MYLYNRSKHCSVKFIDDVFLIQSILLDDFHEMIMEIVIDPEDHIIRDIDFTMRRTPYDYCKGVQIKAKEMKGIKVGPGISGLAKQKLGEASGCYHLLDLFMEGIKVYKQGTARWRFKNNDTEGIKATRKALKDTCYYYSKNHDDTFLPKNGGQQ